MLVKRQRNIIVYVFNISMYELHKSNVQKKSILLSCLNSPIEALKKKKRHIILTAEPLPNDFIVSNSVSSVQSLSRVRLFVTPWTAARLASLSITNSWSPPKPMSIESVMPSNHLILCFPLLLLPSILPSIGVFSNESALHISWPKYWSFSFNISPSNEYPGLVSFRMDWLDLKLYLNNLVFFDGMYKISVRLLLLFCFLSF